MNLIFDILFGLVFFVVAVLRCYYKWKIRHILQKLNP